MGKFTAIDMRGEVCGRLKCIKPVGKSKNGETIWLCRCECGQEKEVTIGNLRKGNTKSCGCFRKERMSRIAKTHGLSLINGKETRLHRIWQNMMNRCFLESHFAYKNYGARGISVCQEWHDYQVFHGWAWQSGYRKDLTIERVDNNGNYSPANCKWIPKGLQTRNQRNTKLKPEDAVKIRRLGAGGVPRNKIAKRFGVSVSHVTSIINHKRW